MKEKVIGKGIGDFIEGQFYDKANGYLGGHGTRILIRAYRFHIDNSNVPNKNEIILGTNFELTVFNWNPNSFNIKNEFGWGNITDPKTKVAQFQLTQTTKRLTIEGTIFNEGIDGLSDLSSGLLTKEPVISEIQNFEKYANSGVIFLLVEPTEKILGETFGGKNIGTFYVESFEYKQSDFIYSNKVQKTVFKIIFKEYVI